MEKVLLESLERVVANGTVAQRKEREGVYVVPSGVKKISDYCFYRESEKQTIMLPNGLEGIGDYAFAGGFNGETIVLPQSLKEIGVGAFNDCQNLRYVRVPWGVKKISRMCFNYCESLKKVVLEGVEEIKEYAFGGCIRLETMYLPKTLKKIIGDGVFPNRKIEIQYEGSKEDFEKVECSSDVREFCLENIKYNCIKEENNHIHNSCSKEKFTTVRNDLFIKNGVLCRENSPKRIVIPAGIEEIDEFCFDKENIIAMELPIGLKKIGIYAFSGYKGDRITFPKGLEHVDFSAFDHSELKWLKIPGSIKSISPYCFYGCKELEEVIVQEGVEGIAMFAFGACENLKSIRLPSTIKWVKRYAFVKCYKLKEIFVRGEENSELRARLESIVPGARIIFKNFS